MSKRINLINYLRHKYLINGWLEEKATVAKIIYELEGMTDQQFVKEVLRTKRVKEVLTTNKKIC